MSIYNLENNGFDKNNVMITPYEGGYNKSVDSVTGRPLVKPATYTFSDLYTRYLSKVKPGNVVRENKEEVYVEFKPTVQSEKPGKVVNGQWVPTNSVSEAYTRQKRINAAYKQAASELGITDNWWKDQRVADRAFQLMKENKI